MKTIEQIKKDALKYSKAAMENKDNPNIPFEFLQDLFNQVKNNNHWKNQTRLFITSYETFAAQMYAAICWFHGGAEISYNTNNATYTITSKGYYHYVGA